MADIVLPVVGAIGGFIIGGPAGAVMGANLGFAASAAFFPKSTHVNLPAQTGPRLSDLRIQTSSYGSVIPQVYGNVRISGNVIWALDIQEVKKETTTTTTASGGKGGGGSSTSSQTTTTYEYYATCAVAVCEGEVDEIIRVWGDTKPLGEDFLKGGEGKYNIYYGTETQNPDPIIESYEGAGNVPAHRGLCYVVIEDLPLASFGNRMPNFTFEVKRNVRFEPAVEDLVKDIVLIPGAGEKVYDTVIQEKVPGQMVGPTFVQQGKRTQINMNNFDSVADASLALDQLEKTFPNLEWVAVVCTWFATSEDAGDCTIVPKVEFTTGAQIQPDGWSVAGLSRGSAQSVLFFDPDTPTYGGTPSDDSIIRLCQAIKAKGWNVMFYPMPFVDTITPNPKPWRGRITPADATDANEFFTKTNGFNAFIRHYSQLSVDGVNLKDIIDAFVIGSEMVGMTGFTDTPGNYPAVNQLVTLAGLVQSDLGGAVSVTYAADWSEYHSTNGWFNMDPLWASSDIDFVGIDSYFPITEDLPQAQITEDLIKEYWEKGEGWDYFWNSARTMQTSYGGDPTYAWKNLEYWWKNTHTNPDMNTTAWTAKQKPVWFTEFGFPSVDGAANQPNVFVDPSSSESFYPRGSRERIDFKAQREAINATLEYLDTREQTAGNTGLVARRFLWTWDARPFPFWPDLANVWQDGDLWKTGHWVNGKLGTSTLGAIVAERLEKSGLDASQFDVTRLTDVVEGFIIIDPMTTRDAIEQLSAAYFFDAVESDGLLKFVKRGGESVVTIDEDKLIPSGKGDVRETLSTTRAQELELPQKINLTYINREFNYDPSTQSSQRQTTNATDQVTFNLPIVLSDQQAKQVADITLYNSWIQRNTYKFTLPPEYAYLEPTDIITIDVNGSGVVMRIIKSDLDRNGQTKINAVSEDVTTYDFYTEPGAAIPTVEAPVVIPDTQARFLDTPPLPADPESQGIMRIAVAGLGDAWDGCVIYRSDDGGVAGGNTFDVLLPITSQGAIGVIQNALPSGTTDTFDFENQIDVLLTAGELSSVTELAILNGANACLAGNEIIQFQNAELVSEGQYRLTKLLRGRLGTESEVAGHAIGDEFTLLTSSLAKVAMPHNVIGLEKFYKPVTIGNTLAVTAEQPFTYTGKALKPFSPVHITGSRDGSLNLTIAWIRRTRTGGEWRDGVDVPLSEESEQYEIDILDGGNIVRTLTSETVGVEYTAADQITDFGSEQASVDVRIYQMSVVVGRGTAGAATV